MTHSIICRLSCSKTSDCSCRNYDEERFLLPLSPGSYLEGWMFLALQRAKLVSRPNHTNDQANAKLCPDSHQPYSWNSIYLRLDSIEKIAVRLHVEVDYFEIVFAQFQISASLCLVSISQLNSKRLIKTLNALI